MKLYLIVTRFFKFIDTDPLFSTFGGSLYNKNNDYEIIAVFDSLKLAKAFEVGYKIHFEEYKGIIEIDINQDNVFFKKPNLINNSQITKFKFFKVSFIKQPYPIILSYYIEDITSNLTHYNEELSSFNNRNLFVKVFALNKEEALKVAYVSIINNILKDSLSSKI